jgi:hypothetical protein
MEVVQNLRIRQPEIAPNRNRVEEEGGRFGSLLVAIRFFFQQPHTCVLFSPPLSDATLDNSALSRCNVSATSARLHRYQQHANDQASLS